MKVIYDEYSVTSDGKVFSANGVELAQKDNGRGYLYVQICGKNGKRKEYVHRLVAKAFVANTGAGKCVNHKDGNKRNNAAWNLEWCTHKENTEHAAKTLGKLTQYQKANKARAKAVIGTFVANPLCEKHYASIHAASKDVGVSRSGIIAALNGKQETSGGMYWRYEQ